MAKTLKLSPRQRRKIRVRKKVVGTTEKPRLCVYRSNKFIYAQLIADNPSVVLGSASSRGDSSPGNVQAAEKVGKKIAEIAKDKNITSVVFDRNGYLYHGRVAALASAAREGGLAF